MMQRGFTLLELLVAISVFAVLSVVAYGGLFSVLETGRYTEQRMQQLERLQMTFFWLGQDLEQLSPRPIRDENGQTSGAFLLNQDDESLVFTRAGRANPAQWPRSALQRVAWQLRDGELIRKSWAVLDRAQDSKADETVLMTGIKHWQMRFLNQDKQWQDSWQTTGDDAGLFPQAVEVTLETGEWGEIQRLFALPESLDNGAQGS